MTKASVIHTYIYTWYVGSLRHSVMFFIYREALSIAKHVLLSHIDLTYLYL